MPTFRSINAHEADERARRELGGANKLGDWNRDDDRRGRDEDPDPRGLKKRR